MTSPRPTAYHRPSDDYRPPTRCEDCGKVIMYGPVIGGHIWMHVGSSDHVVAMRAAGWWDVSAGITRYGNGRAELLDNAVRGVTNE